MPILPPGTSALLRAALARAAASGERTAVSDIAPAAEATASRAFGSMAPAEDVGGALWQHELPAEAPESGLLSAPSIIRSTPSYVTEEGLPIQGKEYSRAAQEVTRSMADEPKGIGPMDLSTASQIPDVEQRGLERYVPKRGVSERVQRALEDPNVVKGVDESIGAGIELGADKWYHTEPVRRAFVGTLGPDEGMKAFRQYMDMVAATSPRSSVPENVRNASYYYGIMKNRGVLPDKAPYPYGHIAQNLHRQNFNTLTADRSLSASGMTGWDVLQNPKPASFAENLSGNLEPGTMDTHAFRNIGMRSGDPRFLATSLMDIARPGAGPEAMQARFAEIKGNKAIYRPQQLVKSGRLSVEEALKIPAFWDSKPNDNEYAAVERLYKQLGEKRGLPTADAQAAAWAGGGKLTGLGTTPDKTFPEMLNERIEYTARMRNENPRDTMRDFIKGKKPLLSVAGATALGLGSAGIGAGGGGGERGQQA